MATGHSAWWQALEQRMYIPRSDRPITESTVGLSLSDPDPLPSPIYAAWSAGSLDGCPCIELMAMGHQPVTSHILNQHNVPPQA